MPAYSSTGAEATVLDLLMNPIVNFASDPTRHAPDFDRARETSLLYEFVEATATETRALQDSR